MTKYYHMIIEKNGHWSEDMTSTRREYIDKRQGRAPQGWHVVGVCGYHEENNYDSTKAARDAAGWRERYAMENGNKNIVYINGHKCFKYTYSKYIKYQDANGATFDTVRGVWIA